MSAQVVVFPDTEVWVMATLRAQLPNYLAQPVRVSETYAGGEYEITVRRDGGPQLDVLRELSRISLNVYAPGEDDTEVVELSRVASAILRAAADGDPVLSVVQDSGPISVPDTVPRRLLGLEITARGAVLDPIP